MPCCLSCSRRPRCRLSRSRSIAAPRSRSRDADFLAARAAYDKGDRAKLAAIAPRLSAHVLAPYVALLAAEAGARRRVAARRSARYLDRYPNTPLADRLRVDWLKSLGRKAQLGALRRRLRAAAGDDVELACYGVLFAWQRDGDARSPTRCRSGSPDQSTPEACEPLFAALIAKRRRSPSADRRARFRLASEAGNVRLAQAIAGDLPARTASPTANSRDVNAIRCGALAQRAASRGTTGGGRDLALFALERAARTDAGAARAAWVKWRDRLPEADRNYGNARLAFHAARQLHPSANDWFREAGDTPLPPEAQALARARGAARAGVGRRPRRRSTPCRAPQQDESAWRYWRARALVATGQRDEGARDLRRRSPTRRSFYGMLAAEAHRPAVHRCPSSIPLEPVAGGARRVRRARRTCKRAVKLAELDMRPESHARVGSTSCAACPTTTRCCSPPIMRAASGLYDRAINTADRTAGAPRLRAALPDAVPQRVRSGGARRTTSTWRCCSASRARNRASFPTSCRRRAPSGSCS